ncbi:MAG: hypothetical protein JWN48_1478 [Myxococcaceae bacterium]|nr:hypothetical protein [Myxococcaceae bacterium]
MTRSRAGAAILTLAIIWSASSGCGEGVGPCHDPLQGRQPVIVNNVVMYGGQAIVIKACATGCHSSSARGAARNGAPAGLDFDLLADTTTTAVTMNEKGESIAKLKPAQVAGLRERRKVIYDQRDEIWQQVSAGLMPPQGKFVSFQKLSSIFSSVKTDACSRNKAYASIATDSSREVLRNWLACGVPIVESNSRVVEKPRVSGAEGYQYPSCERATSSEAEEPPVVSLESLLEGALSSCSACHPILSEPDFSSIDKLRTSLLESSTVICNDKPYLTSGSPEQSFLYDVLAKADPGCGTARMPSGGPFLSDSDLRLVAKWIAAGIPATDDDVAALAADDAAAEASADPSAPDLSNARDASVSDVEPEPAQSP